MCHYKIYKSKDFALIVLNFKNIKLKISNVTLFDDSKFLFFFD